MTRPLADESRALRRARRSAEAVEKIQSEEAAGLQLSITERWHEKRQSAFSIVQLTDNRTLRQDAWGMIKRRARRAGVTHRTCCHSFRATAITEYVRNGGSVENARKMAAHASSRTTNMYLRLDEEMKLEDVERLQI